MKYVKVSWGGRGGVTGEGGSGVGTVILLQGSIKHEFNRQFHLFNVGFSSHPFTALCVILIQTGW